MHFISRLTNRPLFKAVAYQLILVMILIYVVPAHSQESGQKLLTEGKKQYDQGQIDLAIRNLTRSVEIGDLTSDEQMEAYKYLAFAYLAKEFREQAQEAVKKLLNIMPNYKPDPVNDRPEYIQLVEDTKEQIKTPPKPAEKKGFWPKYKTWIIIGSGVVVLGVILLIIIDGGDGEKDLPKPPAFPK